jgi:hypothetical protein
MKKKREVIRGVIGKKLKQDESRFWKQWNRNGMDVEVDGKFGGWEGFGLYWVRISTG